LVLPNDTFDILLARLRTLEYELETLREEVADLRVRVGEAGFDGRP